MDSTKQLILKNIGYTELVYARINKKLKTQLSNSEIEVLILNTITKTPEANFQKIGKNFYVSDIKQKIRITINSSSYNVITVDSLN